MALYLHRLVVADLTRGICASVTLVTEDEALTSIFATLGAGSGWAAEKRGSESAEATFDRADRLPQTVDLLEHVLGALHAAFSREDSPSGEVWLSGTMGSGLLNLNPTLLAAVVRPGADGGAVISVRP